MESRVDDPPLVSILMLTYNAPDFVRIALSTLHDKTKGVKFEVVVLDNSSDQPTRRLIEALQKDGLIDRLVMLDHNSLFSGGNNIAAEHADPRAKYFLLLNSDIRIKRDDWLTKLLEVHRRGLTSYGVNLAPNRVDGYCALIDADLYRKYRLSEEFAWWWSVAKLQSQLLRDGLSVQGYYSHQKYLHHYGGASGKAYIGASGLELDQQELTAWFEGREARVLDPIPPKALHGLRLLLRRLRFAAARRNPHWSFLC